MKGEALKVYITSKKDRKKERMERETSCKKNGQDQA